MQYNKMKNMNGLKDTHERTTVIEWKDENSNQNTGINAEVNTNLP